MTAAATSISWIIGENGLLGAALCRTLRAEGMQFFIPAERFSWDASTALAIQMQSAMAAFALKIGNYQRWEIYWAAGVGSMSSTAEILGPETRALDLMLTLLSGQALIKSTPGTLVFASSAGAIYAGSVDEVITENSVPVPTTAYAVEKLKQEGLVRNFAEVNSSTSVLIARISTLYGPGQANGKKQGLLSYLCRSIIRNQPVHIYVPFDTVRDYINVDDAARAMFAASRPYSQPSRILMKIIASETPTTIAEIISIIKRLSRRTPLVIRSANKLSSLYAKRVQFRSVVFSGELNLPKHRLPVGISELMRSEQRAFVRSSDGLIKIMP